MAGRSVAAFPFPDQPAKLSLLLTGLTALANSPAPPATASLDDPDTLTKTAKVSQRGPRAPTFLTPDQTAELVATFGATDSNINLADACAFCLSARHLKTLDPSADPNHTRNLPLFLRGRSVLASPVKTFLLLPGVNPSTLAAALASADPTQALDALLPRPPPSKRAASRASSRRHNRARAASSAARGRERGTRFMGLDGEIAAKPDPASTLAFLHPSRQETRRPFAYTDPFSVEAIADAVATVQAMLLTRAVALKGSPRPPLLAKPVVLESHADTHETKPHVSLLLDSLEYSVTPASLAGLALHLPHLAWARAFTHPSPNPWDDRASFASIMVPIYIRDDQSWSLAVLTPLKPGAADSAYTLTEYIPLDDGDVPQSPTTTASGPTRFRTDTSSFITPSQPLPGYLRSPSVMPHPTDDALILLYALALGTGNADVLTGQGWWAHLRALPTRTEVNLIALARIRGLLAITLGLAEPPTVSPLEHVLERCTDSDDPGPAASIVALDALSLADASVRSEVLAALAGSDAARRITDHLDSLLWHRDGSAELSVIDAQYVVDSLAARTAPHVLLNPVALAHAAESAWFRAASTRPRPRDAALLLRSLFNTRVAAYESLSFTEYIRMLKDASLASIVSNNTHWVAATWSFGYNADGIMAATVSIWDPFLDHSSSSDSDSDSSSGGKSSQCSAVVSKLAQTLYAALLDPCPRPGLRPPPIPIASSVHPAPYTQNDVVSCGYAALLTLADLAAPTPVPDHRTRLPRLASAARIYLAGLAVGSSTLTEPRAKPPTPDLRADLIALGVHSSHPALANLDAPPEPAAALIDLSSTTSSSQKKKTTGKGRRRKKRKAPSTSTPPRPSSGRKRAKPLKMRA